MFRIEAIRLQGMSKAEVDGGYYEAGLSASGNTYSLVRKDGVWSVVKRRDALDLMKWATGDIGNASVRRHR